MAKASHTQGSMMIGMGLGDRNRLPLSVLDSDGQVVREASVATTTKAMAQALGSIGGSDIARDREDNPRERPASH
jgi:hypothetical protein